MKPKTQCPHCDARFTLIYTHIALAHPDADSATTERYIEEMGQSYISNSTARALVLHFGLRGAIDYATKIFQMGGPLATEYGWLADYLTTYKAATEVGPQEFSK